MTYDLFLSYSTDPDYALSRKVESFLESFHKLKVPQNIALRKLSVCRDGSDFTMQGMKRDAEESADPSLFIKNILKQYLEDSDYLLVLCSVNARVSQFVQFEINWFIQNKGPEKVLLGITECDVSVENYDSIFPPAILDLSIHHRPYYDFRKFKKNHAEWKRVRDYEEELTNLAAHLNNQTSGVILPFWQRQEKRKLRRQRFIGIAVASFFAALSIVAFFQRQAAVNNARIANENLKKFKKEQLQRNIRNGIVYLDAQEDSFAVAEFMAADSIIAAYPTDSSIVSQKPIVTEMIKKCLR